MAKKATKVVRKSLGDKLVEARADGFKSGHLEGMAMQRRNYLPDYQLKGGLGEFVRTIGSWPLAEHAVVQIFGTDLKSAASLNVPVRLLRAVASELKRLGYGATDS